MPVARQSAANIGTGTARRVKSRILERHLVLRVGRSPKVLAGISMEQLLEELRQMQESVLLYPPQGDKGPNRVATVLSKQTLPQVALAKTLGLDQLRITPRG